jgi:hypothetical protein
MNENNIKTWSLETKLIAASSQNIQIPILEYLSKDKSKYVRMAVASNEREDIESILDQMIKDPDIEVLRVLSKNKCISDHMLTSFLESKDEAVSTNALNEVFSRTCKKRHDGFEFTNIESLHSMLHGYVLDIEDVKVSPLQKRLIKDKIRECINKLSSEQLVDGVDNWFSSDYIISIVAEIGIASSDADIIESVIDKADVNILDKIASSSYIVIEKDEKLKDKLILALENGIQNLSEIHFCSFINSIQSPISAELIEKHFDKIGQKNHQTEKLNSLSENLPVFPRLENTEISKEISFSKNALSCLHNRYKTNPELKPKDSKGVTNIDLSYAQAPKLSENIISDNQRILKGLFKYTEYAPDKDLLENIIDKMSPESIEEFYNENPDCSVIKKALIASDSKTPLFILEKLYKERILEIGCALGINPNVPIGMLFKLSNSPYQSVRMIIARNPRTPLECLYRIANSVVLTEGEIHNLLDNPEVDHVILQRLFASHFKSEDIKSKINKVICEFCSYAIEKDVTLKSYSDEIKKFLAKNHTPQEKNLFYSKNLLNDFTNECLENPNLNEGQLHYIWGSCGNVNLLKQIAFHPNAPLDIINCYLKQKTTSPRDKSRIQLNGFRKIEEYISSNKVNNLFVCLGEDIKNWLSDQNYFDILKNKFTSVSSLAFIIPIVQNRIKEKTLDISILKLIEEHPNYTKELRESMHIYTSNIEKSTAFPIVENNTSIPQVPSVADVCEVHEKKFKFKYSDSFDAIKIDIDDFWTFYGTGTNKLDIILDVCHEIFKKTDTEHVYNVWSFFSKKENLGDISVLWKHIIKWTPYVDSIEKMVLGIEKYNQKYMGSQFDWKDFGSVLTSLSYYCYLVKSDAFTCSVIINNISDIGSDYLDSLDSNIMSNIIHSSHVKTETLIKILDSAIQSKQKVINFIIASLQIHNKKNITPELLDKIADFKDLDSKQCTWIANEKISKETLLKIALKANTMDVLKNESVDEFVLLRLLEKDENIFLDSVDGSVCDALAKHSCCTKPIMDILIGKANEKQNLYWQESINKSGKELQEALSKYSELERYFIASYHYFDKENSNWEEVYEILSKEKPESLVGTALRRNPLWNKCSAGIKKSFENTSLKWIKSKPEDTDRIRGKKSFDCIIFDEVQDLSSLTSVPITHEKYGPKGDGLQIRFKKPKSQDSFEKQVAMRVCCDLTSEGAKELVLGILQKHTKDNSVLDVISEILDGEIGQGLLSLLFGLGIPQLKNTDYFEPSTKDLLDDISDEFLIQSGSKIGKGALKNLLQMFLPVIQSALDSFQESSKESEEIVLKTENKTISA